MIAFQIADFSVSDIDSDSIFIMRVVILINEIGGHVKIMTLFCFPAADETQVVLIEGLSNNMKFIVPITRNILCFHFYPLFQSMGCVLSPHALGQGDCFLT